MRTVMHTNTLHVVVYLVVLHTEIVKLWMRL